MKFTKDDLHQLTENQILNLLNKKILKLPKKSLSKNETFEQTITSLEKEYPEGIPGEKIILELEKTGIFIRIQARNHLDRYCRGGYLFEPKPGYFKIL